MVITTTLLSSPKQLYQFIRNKPLGLYHDPQQKIPKATYLITIFKYQVSLYTILHMIHYLTNNNCYQLAIAIKGIFCLPISLILPMIKMTSSDVFQREFGNFLFTSCFLLYILRKLFSQQWAPIILGFNHFLGSGHDRGRSPVEWGGFPSRCSNFSKKLSKPHCYICLPVHDFVVVKTALLYSTSVNAGISCWVECGKTAERCQLVRLRFLLQARMDRKWFLWIQWLREKSLLHQVCSMNRN